MVDEVFTLIHNLWEYGVHEHTPKIDSNLGLLGNQVVLVDAFELTDDKGLVKRQLTKAPWREKEALRKSLSSKLMGYFNVRAESELTPQKLETCWKRSSKEK